MKKDSNENILETHSDGSYVVEYFENEGTPDERYVIEERNSGGICVKGYAYTDKTKSKLLETITLLEIKPNGNNVKELILETAENDGSKYILGEYDSNDNPVWAAAYTDKNKSKLIYRIEIINRKENGSFTVKQVYEELQDGNCCCCCCGCGWQSAIDDRDEQERPIHTCYYSDKNFQNLCEVRDFEYRPDGGKIVKRAYAAENYYEIVEYDKNNRAISTQIFSDKEFRNCLSSIDTVYFQDGSREEKIWSFVENTESGIARYNSGILKWNSKDQLVRHEAYKGQNFEELISTCTQINNPDGSYILRTVDRETKTSKIESYDASHRLICEQRYLDMDFKILDWTSKSSYNADGTSVDKTQYEKPEYGIQSKIVYFNSDGKWVSQLRYKDKKFKELYSTEEKIYNSDGSSIIKGWLEKPEYGIQSKIVYYNSDDEWISWLSYEDKNFKNLVEKEEREIHPDGSYTVKHVKERCFDCDEYQSYIEEFDSYDRSLGGKSYIDKEFKVLFSTGEKIYKNDGSSVVKLHYVKPKNGIWTKITKLDADGNTISETESKEKDI